MQEVLDTLCRRLIQRGLMPIEIVRLMRDVSNIFGDGGYFSVSRLNSELRRLGWLDRIIDDSILELILYYLESEGTYSVERYSIE